jgi:hypothetical protein
MILYCWALAPSFKDNAPTIEIPSELPSDTIVFMHSIPIWAVPMATTTKVNELQAILGQVRRNLEHYEKRLDELLRQKENGESLPSSRIQQEEESIREYQAILKDLEMQISLVKATGGS